LQEKQAELERSKAQAETSHTATEQARRFLDNYILQVKKRTAEAQQLVNDARAAKMQEQLSQTMASFQVGDNAGTFDEMRDRIQRRSAAAEARMELATGGVEAQIQDIERESLNIQVEDTLAAYKRQMSVGSGSAPTVPAPSALERESAEKTLGPAEKTRALE
jgi:phage shock protein A